MSNATDVSTFTEQTPPATPARSTDLAVRLDEIVSLTMNYATETGPDRDYRRIAFDDLQEAKRLFLEDFKPRP